MLPFRVKFIRNIKDFNTNFIYRIVYNSTLCTSGRYNESSLTTRNSNTLNVKSAQLLTQYAENGQLLPKTHGVGDLTSRLIGQNVVVHGYLGSRSDLSQKLSFARVTSEDMSRSIQIVSRQNDHGIPLGSRDSHAKLKSIPTHSPITVIGTVKAKHKSSKIKTADETSPTEDIEIHVSDIKCLNSFPKDTLLTDGMNFPPEQRYLQIRTDPKLRYALNFRSKVNRIIRQYLGEIHGFTDVETPILFKSTPEGAQEFIVPTRHAGRAYALPQSPQQYKQILMASGISKYFQIARCFRDEDLRADRQPEFTQLDVEMSFATGQDVMVCIERLIRHLWHELQIDSIEPIVFRHLTFHEAMSTYGTDKPDTRFGMKIQQIQQHVPIEFVQKITKLHEPVVECIKFHVSDDPSITRMAAGKFMCSDRVTNLLERYDGMPGILVLDDKLPLYGLSSLGHWSAHELRDRLKLSQGDILIIVARENGPFKEASTVLGNLRTAFHEYLLAESHIIKPTRTEFLWITNFPMFFPISSTGSASTQNGIRTGQRYVESVHHPFTAPYSVSDVEAILEGRELEAIADHYDLVINGVEVGGGSRRIHVAELQEYIFKCVLHLSAKEIENFQHLQRVLQSGCPPHAGFALGLDRLLCLMLGLETVRDVIAFPKSASGVDAQVGSPSLLTDDQLERFNLAIKRPS